MYSPVPHDLTIYDGEFDFEKNGFCPHQWEISVPQKNCVIWGVVLSYLRSADFTAPGEFEERLSRLTVNAFDADAVKSSILDFNPFFNIHKCFFDETLQKVGQSFRKVLSENRPWTERKTVAHDMQLISTLLKSNILIVDLSCKNLHLVTPSEGCSEHLASITLFCREYSNNDGKKPVVSKRFTYSLNRDLCWELRTSALRIILESSETRDVAEREIQPLTEREEKKENILIAFLKKDLTHVILELYDSSYIVAKLSDAGFETDPRVLDSDGFSAFYHALQSEDKNIVYVLYRYAANNCYETENTFRDPSPCIISNFSKLKGILEGDCTRSNNFEAFGDRAEEARVTYQDLLRFNDFLTQVSRGINDIREKPEGNSLEVAVKHRDRILLILDQYDAFFTVGQLDSPQISEKELRENYTEHKTYYDNLDFTAAPLFFDNIFLLKGVLRSPRKGLYSELESSFIFSAIINKYFTGDAKNGIKIGNSDFDLDSRVLSVLPLLGRLYLREKVKQFCNIFREKKLFVEDLVQCIPQHEIERLAGYFRELEDEFLISRLDRYLKTALETTPEGLKQRLTIERSLQVIGESINIEEGEPSSIRHLLRKCLPGDTLDILKKVRNTLSHLKSFQFPLKFETEENDGLFTSIQSEIRNIKEAFEKVFDIQRIRLIEFLINRGLESAQKLKEDTGIDMHPLVQSMKNFGEALRKKSAELECGLDQAGVDGDCIYVPGISQFCRKLMGFASRIQVENIRDEIPLEVRTRIVAIEKLERDLERDVAIDVDRFDNLFLETKDLCSIKNEYEKYLQDESEAGQDQTYKKSILLHKIKKAPTPLNTLDKIFEKMKVSDSQLKALYEAIPFSPKSNCILNSLIEISKSPSGDNLANLSKRIEHLFRISIDERHDIRSLWERGKSPKAKQHLVYKIVQRYLCEPSFQASMEMLLFDCFAVLENNENFGCFWKKDSLLFNSIDLRNVLDDILLVSVGDIVDPKDLPSELVKKMLQLFEDRECIDTLRDLWQKEKRSSKSLDRSSEWYKSKRRIVSCARWQEYFHLLAENPKDLELCDALVSFLINETLLAKPTPMGRRIIGQKK